MKFEVEKGDLCLIGHTAYNEGGHMAVVCSIDSANLEYILLRNILKCFGEEYRIVESFEVFEDETNLLSVKDKVFITNLPFENCLNIDSSYGEIFNDERTKI